LDSVVSGEHQVGPEKHQVGLGEHQVGSQGWEPPPWRSAAVLRILAGGPASRAEVFAALGVHGDYRAYTRHLVPLLDRALIAMTNPDNPTAATQRYELTPAGQALVAGLDAGDDE
jgi:hypothetical protein